MVADVYNPSHFRGQNTGSRFETNSGKKLARPPSQQTSQTWWYPFVISAMQGA
jgi:hypothetical protein